MSDVNLMEALERINEIHGHMAKGEIYRGFRPLPVALAGCGGLIAAAFQGYFVDAAQPVTFVYYWLAAAMLCAFLAGPTLPLDFLRQNEYDKRRTLHVWGQFLPCLVAGAVTGIAIGRSMPECVPLLPGLWAILFSLGVFSCRPFLPRATGWIALFYLAAGTIMLLYPNPINQGAWPMALTFAVGQVAGGIMLRVNWKRSFA